ncbi:hypothetical protein PG991_013436 [Apiospora marii]|uniref:Nephrocystin 3-like N-terminal domain-containing protein n=1 Tax=Apiospora marii TaxID=335849 RepID=A0ABR1R7W8_9PEZI
MFANLIRDNSGRGTQNASANSATQSNNNGGGQQINNYYSDCLGSLVYPEINYRLADIAPALPDTCDWLSDTFEFLEWLDSLCLPTHNGVLWIKGKPGSGKSTLMKHALARYNNNLFHDHLITAHFFNGRGETLEKTPLGMLRSIVYQLLRDDVALYDSFIPLFREKQRINKENKETRWQWRESELKGFLHSIVKVPPSKPLLILVDALDECEEPEARRSVEFLESLSICAIRNDFRLRICLSSRHYPSIVMSKVLELSVETSPDHDADISKYIGERLRVHDPAMEHKILEKANGIFLWVVLVTSLLNKAYDEGHNEAMWKALGEIPGDLDDMFSEILLKKTLDTHETIAMLQWVLCSKRLLTPAELYAAVTGNAPQTIEVIQRRITTSSKGLIEIRNGGIAVQFIHTSVKDFLLEQNRLQRFDPLLGPDPIATIHGRLWARCSEMIGRSTLTCYAAQHILEHAEEALSTDTVQPKISTSDLEKTSLGFLG